MVMKDRRNPGYTLKQRFGVNCKSLGLLYILHELDAEIQPLSPSKSKDKTENIQVLTSVARKSHKYVR